MSAKLAREAKVSGPTVIRFANRLGFMTYADFQEVLRDEIDARVLSPVSLYRTRSCESTGPHGDVADAIVDAARQTLRNLSSDEFWAACRLIAVEATRVLAFGGWYSRIHAQYLTALLQEVRPNARFLDDSASERVEALVDARRGNVAVAFDFRRYEDATIKLANDLHTSGARVVLVTDRWLSPAAAFADVVLPTIVDGPSAYDTLVPGLAVVELLVSGIVQLLGAAGQRRFEKFSRVSSAMTHRWGAAGNGTGNAGGRDTEGEKAAGTQHREAPRKRS